jgi:hypothetical protein
MLRLTGGQPYDLGHRSAQISIKAAAKPDALAEEKTRIEMERAKMARLKAARLAAEAKAGVKPKAKRKGAAAGTKGKR